jgi:hypothetical protein
MLGGPPLVFAAEAILNAVYNNNNNKLTIN